SLVFGVVLAFLLGTVYAVIRHRIVDHGEQIAVLTAAGMAFLLTAVVPAIRYPANPPGIGDPDTLFKRSLAYFTLIVACLVVFAAVAVLFGWLKGRVDGATRLVVTVVVGVLAIAVVMLIWPDTNDPLPEKISALMVWSFRVRSLGGLALYWGVVGLLSGWLLSRVSASSVEKSETTASPAPSSAAAPN
ncbi:MAG TPA: CbtA family protein, partial [Mycobacterium sp.]|nr:CbtA family protein [Mycobacterium sp.]